MHQKPSSEAGATDSAVLGLLIHEGSRPWSDAEVERQMGADVTDALGRLHGAGLAHRLDGFVWATRAAVAGDELGR
jgi:hypothetical protein